MSFTKGVTAGNQRDRFLVVHCHACECLADVVSGCDRIGLAVWSFRIDVGEAHLYCAERVLNFALAAAAAVAFVAEPCPFRSPVELLWFPGVGATAGKTESLEAHRLERDVADQHKQIGPGNSATVFLFDGPQEPARLVEVRVVGPTVEWRKTLLPATSSAAAIRDTVSAGAVPGKADEQATVMTKVGRQPLLGAR